MSYFSTLPEGTECNTLYVCFTYLVYPESSITNKELDEQQEQGCLVLLCWVLLDCEKS